MDQSNTLLSDDCLHQFERGGCCVSDRIQQVKSYQALDLESYDVFLKFAPDPTRLNFAYSLIERQNPHLQHPIILI